MARPVQADKNKRNRFNDRFQNHEPVLDADFETVEAAVHIKPVKPVTVDAQMPAGGKTHLSASKINKIGMSVFGKKPAKPMPDDSIAFYGFGTVLVMLSFWVFGGHSLFRTVDMMPVASIGRAANGAEIIDASWRVVTSDGRTALQLQGIVRNAGATSIHAKPVMVTVKHQDGATKRYSLGQKGWTLGPGQEVVVSGRLDIQSANIASVDIALTQ